jgi:capsular polysaccharide biosynthesis protein
VSGPQAEFDPHSVVKGPPSGYFVVLPSPTTGDDSADLGSIWSVVKGAWKLLMTTTLIAAVIAAAASLQMRKTYRAHAMIAPVTQMVGGAGGALKQFGGLAALAGIDIAGGGHTEEYFATLASPGFARDFIVAENLMPVLFAEDWDPATNDWKPDVDPKPTLEKGVREFTRGVRSIAEDRKTSLVTVTVEWYSPELAATWANKMIDMVNERLRNEALRSSEQSIKYLDNELTKTNVVEVRQAIYKLIEGQVNNAMIANVQHEYAFRFIDRAVPPDLKSSPKRALITAVGAGIGLFIGLVIVFVRRSLAERK